MRTGKGLQPFVTISANKPATSKFHFLGIVYGIQPMDHQSFIICSFGIIALDNRKSKEMICTVTILKINYRCLHSQP